MKKLLIYTAIIFNMHCIAYRDNPLYVCKKYLESQSQYVDAEIKNSCSEIVTSLNLLKEKTEKLYDTVQDYNKLSHEEQQQFHTLNEELTRILILTEKLSDSFQKESWPSYLLHNPDMKIYGSIGGGVVSTIAIAYLLHSKNK